MDLEGVVIFGEDGNLGVGGGYGYCVLDWDEIAENGEGLGVAYAD